MNAAFKVGLITILTLATVLFGVVFIWQINPYAYYPLYSYFPHVGGISVGSTVTLMGVKIGEVQAIEPEPAARRVKVSLNIDRKHQLPVGSTFTIVTTGLVGDKNVEVQPPLEEITEMLAPGATVSGIPPASLDKIFTEAQDMLKSARSLVEDEDLRADIKTTVKMVAQASGQMEGLFKDLKGVTRGFGRLTAQTEILLRQINGATAAALPDVQNTVRSVRRIAYNLETFSGRVNELTNDPVLLGEGRSTAQNIRTLTQQWNDLTEDLRGLTVQAGDVLDNAGAITNDIREITSDAEIKANVKTVARNATQLTTAVLNLATPEQPGTRPLKLDLRTEGLGVARLSQDFALTPGAMVNFNIFGDLGLDFPVSYFRVGLDEIGDANLINLQAGSQLGDGTGVVRFGLVRGRIGAGTDLNLQFLEQNLTLSGELYDINSPRMRLGLLQDIYQDYGVSLYWDNQFLRGINEFSVGLRWQPGNNKPSPSPLPISSSTP
ncbi:MAG: MlaD family protein [Candidatus Sericytochromatia bacterium]